MWDHIYLWSKVKIFIKKIKQKNLINSNYSFHLISKRYVVWPTKTKNVQSMAYSSLWSDGRADDHKAQQQQLSPLLFVLTVVWTQLSSGPGSTIHKYQVAAFSSISVVVYKVQALHFLTQPPQDSSLLWPRPCRSNTAIVDLYPPPPPSSLAQQRSLRSHHGCCLSAPPAASRCTAMTPALLASTASLQSGHEEGHWG